MEISSIQLKAFMTVVRTGHFSKSSKLLGISQSALSQRILNLEDQLEKALLIRDRQGLRTTEAGDRLLEYCRMTAAMEKDLFHDLFPTQRGKLSGELRIGGFSTCVRSFIMPKFLKIVRDNPALRLHIMTREMRDLPQLFRRGEVDFMVLDHHLEADNYFSEKIGEEINVPIESTKWKSPDIYLDHDESDQTTFQFFKLNKMNTDVRRNYLDDIYGIIDGVQAGWGKAIVPQHMIENIRGIKIIPHKKSLKIPFILHYRKQSYYSKIHQLTLETLRA